uniref:Uncharacterized protein n=1 Tax=Rhizophora mucronata TaxID=61149 RepID=A0A2P2NKW6_RHIMU
MTFNLGDTWIDVNFL